MRNLARYALPLAIFAICATLLWPRLMVLDTAALAQHWGALSGWQWAAAAVFTALSFWAVGQYDIIAHRHIDSGLPAPRARRVGMSAIALAQTTGFGVVTGTLGRWRLTPELGPIVAAQITGFVSVLFMAALTATAALLCLVLPTPGGLILPALAALVLLCVAGGAALWKPRVVVKDRVIQLPSLRAMLAAFGWALLDVMAAACAMYVLFPSGHAPDFLAFLPIFCLALAAGLFSGTPGGVGPFEVTLLALTAQGMPAAVPPAAALVAVMGFRLIYFAVPAVIGAAMIARRPRARIMGDRRRGTPLSNAPRAEIAVIGQNGGRITRLDRRHAALWPTAQALICLFDPFEGPPDCADLRCFESQAARRNRVAGFYKAQGRSALAARRAGWSVMHIADDAVLDLENFVLSGSERARLRRKLRQADKAGLTLRRAVPADLPQLKEIDAQWQQEHGEARGGTIGLFCAAYLRNQAVFVAEQDTQITAFVSFHVMDREWALDLMRHRTDLPDGTMHALVHAGLCAAQSSGVPRLSLSAVPACPDPARPLHRWAAGKIVQRAGGTGLRQFKSAFGPRWMPLYAAAPGPLSLTIVLADVVLSVLRPVTVPADMPVSADELVQELNAGHNEDEHYELVSNRVA